tara:strand:- start:664 stop:966 length:303 start_codon:yes stop_codon:yes gene_type:complete
MYFSTDCNNAFTIGITELSNTPKQLLKIVDLMVRETPYKPNTTLIYVFDDGRLTRYLFINTLILRQISKELYLIVWLFCFLVNNIRLALIKTNNYEKGAS